MRVVREFRVSDPPGVHARGTDPDLSAVPPDASQHELRVVVALRDLLVLLRAGGSIPYQEHLDRFAIALGQ